MSDGEIGDKISHRHMEFTDDKKRNSKFLWFLFLVAVMLAGCSIDDDDKEYGLKKNFRGLNCSLCFLSFYAVSLEQLSRS